MFTSPNPPLSQKQENLPQYSMACSNDVKEILDCTLSSGWWGRHGQKELNSGKRGSTWLRLMSTINNVREDNIPPNFYISSPFWRIANLYTVCATYDTTWIQWQRGWNVSANNCNSFPHTGSRDLFPMNPALVHSPVFLWRHWSIYI